MSNMAAALDTLIDAWVSTAPLSRATRGYHLLDGREIDDSPAAADRGFMFDIPVRNGPTGEYGDGNVQVSWDVNVFYFVAKAGRGYLDAAKAVAEEVNHLSLIVEDLVSWPSGVVEVITRGMVVTEENDDLVVVSIPLQIITGETLV